MKNEIPNAWRREELLSLLATSGTLAGLCITVVAFLQSLDKARLAATLVDDVFALCAAVFLLCTYLIFWGLRTRKPTLAERLTRVVDVAFLAALTLMTFAGVGLVYAIW